MSKVALVTGIKGQGGAYLAEHLINNGYKVIGCDRRRVDINNWRLLYLGIEKEIEYTYMDLLDEGSIQRAIRKYKPSEFYNLAAQSFVGASFDQPYLTSQVNGIGVLKILESLREFKPDCKFYQASTSEMFGAVRETPQNEMTPFNPRSPYGVSKIFAHYMTINYREAYDMYACCGILFNHESPLRGGEFVTCKIVENVGQIFRGEKEYMELGNINAKRDWGYAKDFTYGIYQIMQQGTPDDYVLATGQTHSVREFVERAFQKVDMIITWEGEGLNEIGICTQTNKTVVKISSKFYRPSDVDILTGDYSKANKTFGWTPSTTFEELINIMMEYELNKK